MAEAQFGANRIGRFEADPRDIAGEQIGVGPHAGDGVLAVEFIHPQGAARADAVAVQEDHDVADGLLLGPGALDLLAAAGADTLDFLQAGRRYFDDVENILPEFVHELLRVNRADTPDEPAAEVFLDAFARVRRLAADVLRTQLHSMLAIALPVPLSGDPLAGRNGRDDADHSDKIPAPLDLHLEDGEARVLIMECDAFNQAGETVGGSGSPCCHAS